MILKNLRRLWPDALHPRLLLEKEIRERTGLMVRRGPFAGLQYVGASVGSQLCPKLLGTYERELEEVTEKVISGKYTLLVDVGAAEGYYAVGVAWRQAAMHVVAFESEKQGQALIREMAKRNGCDARVTVLGHCGVEDLRRALAMDESVVVICDVEGGEDELLNPDVIPSLERVAILVETHDFLRPGIADDLRHRFAETHEVVTIRATPRKESDYPYRDGWARWVPARYVRTVVSEFRPSQQEWLWMRPRPVEGSRR